MLVSEMEALLDYVCAEPPCEAPMMFCDPCTRWTCECHRAAYCREKGHRLDKL